MLLIPMAVLRACVTAARSAHPNESLLLLQGRRDGENVRLSGARLPAGLSVDEDSAHFQPWMMPSSIDYIGVFHSHPSGGPHPSGADLFLASKEGGVQLLLAYPYSPDGLVAYDPRGQPLRYRIVP
ncbi:putative metalloprotease [uncultured archaeon]|nr:putative metalloprotease [uncultured archaeon]